jgi:HPt (histidine-containing phosphotransfer) domain-containing protein
MKQQFDLSYLHSLSDDPSFVPQMIQTFLNIVPTQIESLKEAVENDDAKQTSLVLHQIKPSMQVFGYNTIIPEISALELFAKTGNAPSSQIDRYVELIDDISQCIASIKQLQKENEQLPER